MKYINSKFIKNLSITDVKAINKMICNIKNGDSFCYGIDCVDCIFSDYRNIHDVDCRNGDRSSLLSGKKNRMIFVKDLEELKSLVTFPNGYKRFIGR